MATVQTFDSSVNLLRAILWQYDSAPRLRSLLEQKQSWYDVNQAAFWDDWFTDVFDLRTANEFGLSVWAVLLDVPLVINAPPTDDRPVFGFGVYNRNFFDGYFGRDTGNAFPLTVEQKRLVLRLRYFQLVTRGAVTEINAFLAQIFADEGRVYVADNLDMSIGYIFDFVPSAALRQVLENYDLLPRPAGVRVGYLVQPTNSFGFAPFWANFFDGNFGGVFP
jgi:hypothetical protein